MKNLIALATVLSLLFACGKQETPPPPAPVTAPVSSGPRPEKAANGQPAIITVQHVLISFEGSERSEQKRSRAEAEKLAFEIVNRAKNGEDFGKLMKEFSNDPGGGTYTLVNDGLTPNQAAGEYERRGMVAAFGDVGFRIDVGEVGLADYDAKGSPFGLHIIKRIK
jgi:parvulin-like peptidyl-prolyl isomerase